MQKQKFRLHYFVVGKTYTVDAAPHTVDVTLVPRPEPYDNSALFYELITRTEHKLHAVFNANDTYSFTKIERI